MTDQPNPASRDWKIVEQWANAQLDEYRKRNDNRSLDAVQTAFLRGQIAATKATLALATPPTRESTPDDEPLGQE